MKHLGFRLLIFVFVATFFVALGLPTLAAESPRLVRIGVYNNPPKIFRDNSGEVSGLFGDLLHYIARQENWELVFIDGTFDESMARLNSGQIDVMVDVAASAEREKLFDLTQETVMGSWGVVYGRNDSEIDSFADLNHKKIALLKSSVYFQGAGGINTYVKAFGLDVEFIQVNEYDEVYQLLMSGEVDAGVVSRISGLAAEQKYPNLKATNIIFSPTELRFALTKGDVDNPYLIEKIDYWVKKLKDGHEGIYQEILAKHQLSGIVTRVTVVPDWVYPTTITGVFLIVTSWLLVIGFRQARKRALTNLAKSDRYLKAVINNTPVILSAIDKNGIITMAEGQALSALGLKSSQLVGQSLYELYKDNETIIKHTNIALAGNATRFKTNMGDRTFIVNVAPIKNSKKELELVSVAVDTTEDGKLEKAKTEFLRLVQHQLRTPPTAVRWAAELLNPVVDKVLKDDELELWNTLKGANDRMISLANTLSLVSEITTGNFVLNPSKVKVKDLIEDVLSAHKKTIKEKKIKIAVEADDLREVKMDKHLAGVVFQALVSNAIIYSDKDKKILIRFSDKPKAYLIEVIDKGWGIPEDDQHKIFTQFFRGTEANRTNPDGLGMALYTTKTILTLIGGKIWFTSIAGKGSTFFVELPKSQPDQAITVE